MEAEKYQGVVSQVATTMTDSAGRLEDAAYIRAVRSPYSPMQVRAYMEKIGWDGVTPAWSSESDLDSGRVPFDASLDNLARLMFLHTLAFPQDTSDLH
jgi:hypothetical protein